MGGESGKQDAYGSWQPMPLQTCLIGDTFSDGELNDDEVLEDSVSGDRECSIRRFDHCIKHQVWSRNKKVKI